MFFRNIKKGEVIKITYEPFANFKRDIIDSMLDQVKKILDNK